MNRESMNRLKNYSACQAADAFDKLKIRGHMPDIILLSPDPDYRMVGEAHTVRMVPAGGGPLPKREVHHIDAAPEGSIVVISIPSGVTTANWGGMMSTRAQSNETWRSRTGRQSQRYRRTPPDGIPRIRPEGSRFTAAAGIRFPSVWESRSIAGASR